MWHWACNLTPLHQPPRLIAVPTPYKGWTEIRREGLHIINSWKISHIILVMEKCWGLLKQDGDTSSYTGGQGHNFLCNLWIKNLLQKSIFPHCSLIQKWDFQQWIWSNLVPKSIPMLCGLDVVECHLHFFCTSKASLRELIQNLLSVSFCQCPGESFYPNSGVLSWRCFPPLWGTFGSVWSHIWLSQLGRSYWHLVGRVQGCC